MGPHVSSVDGPSLDGQLSLAHPNPPFSSHLGRPCTDNFMMIRGILIFLILITEVRRKFLYNNHCTYLWGFLTLLCSVFVLSFLRYSRRGSKSQWKIKGKVFPPGTENETSPRSGCNPFWSPTLTIGAYHHREKIPPGFMNKKENLISLRLYEKGIIGTWPLLLQIHGDNFFPSFFFPFLSTLLALKYDVLNSGPAKLSLALVNEFLLGSVFLRYVRVNAWAYLLFYVLLFLATLGAMRIHESFATCSLWFALNFVFYHMIGIAAFRLTDGVFSFLEGATVSVAGTLLLDAYAYGLFHAHLDGNVVPSVLSVFLSGVALSLTLYAAYCAYLLRRADDQKGKVLIASLAFLLYNILNLGARRYDSLSETDTSAMQTLVHLLWNQQNYILIFAWLVITTLYVVYIAKSVRRNGNLSYLRKHYHFLLFVNVQLAFLLGKVELLVVTLSFAFLLLLFLEVTRKIGEALSPDRNALHKFFTSFTDDRDRKGLVVTHIYLLAGVYIPIVADASLNNKNYLRKGTRSVFLFRDADLLLYSSGLNAICIGDSFAAIGGLLFPTPKIRKTNNKSYAGFLFFFCSTFLSLLLESYFVQKTPLASLTAIFMVSLFGALFEAYLHDIDNLILPLFTFCVPSDITILEHKYARKNEKRRINFFKRLFIHFSFFTIGNNCNKLSSHDVIKVLSNVYVDDPSESRNLNPINIINILNTRQRDIEKQVQCKLWSFVGFLLLPLYSLNKFKYYDAKSKIIVAPFFSIAGIYLGSFLGNVATGSNRMKLFQRGLLPLVCCSACLSLLTGTDAVAYDLSNLGSAEKRLALNLLQVFEETRSAERGFYERLDNSQKIFDEVGAGRAPKGGGIGGGGIGSGVVRGTPPSSFVQVKSKGPVEEETIWRALYDTQLRRSPPNEQVHVYSLENVSKEFEQAQAEAFVSQIVTLKNQFELNLNRMREELPRVKKVHEAINEAIALEERVGQVGLARGSSKNAALRGDSGTKVLC
ncbi:hypothetical protein C922_04874 [Plasmodium inui San Antonio 1]|uniref:dolichol kinase n=1 Tax=Plasmodium inui San Antonio 1 TaxID=1237626 RepID=W6ZZL6_9APIC|nr:hypothetical protein C922_04874 [Plasmodium inui San Antonio 1]EUD64730.1 hypothetical protein C922_04874 [Plasmodium inui San Antonio 1]